MKCPECKTVWQWDWDQDLLRKPSGEQCKTLLRRLPKGIELEAMLCDCGLLLCVGVVDPSRGGWVYNHPEIARIDWEARVNSYQPMDIK